MCTNKIQTIQVYDIESQIIIFQKSNNFEDRYSSYDYCYNYFRNNSAEEIEQDMEKSCLELGFFLASWGMLRGSSFLLQKSAKYYEKLVNYIIDKKRTNPEYWELGNYEKIDENGIEAILDIYYDIEEILGDENPKKNYSTQITKIMLGVFACIPAFDDYFVKTFNKMYPRKFLSNINSSKVEREVLKRHLCIIISFYNSNKACIDILNICIYTKDFKTAKKTGNRYTKAKIIDMYGFQKSLKEEE